MRLLKIVLLLIVLMLCLTLLVACEPRAPFQIRNDTDQTLNIYISASAMDHVDPREEQVFVGSVEPGKILKPQGLLGGLRAYLVEARDLYGKLVYTQEFKGEELAKANWKVVIPASR